MPAEFAESVRAGREGNKAREREALQQGSSSSTPAVELQRRRLPASQHQRSGGQAVPI